VLEGGVTQGEERRLDWWQGRVHLLCGPGEGRFSYDSCCKGHKVFWHRRVAALQSNSRLAGRERAHVKSTLRKGGLACSHARVVLRPGLWRGLSSARQTLTSRSDRTGPSSGLGGGVPFMVALAILEGDPSGRDRSLSCALGSGCSGHLHPSYGEARHPAGKSFSTGWRFNPWGRDRHLSQRPQPHWLSLHGWSEDLRRRRYGSGSGLKLPDR